MDQTNLITVLADKYNIDVSSDIKVMELFNKLCMSVDNEKTIQELDKGATEAGVYFNDELERKMSALKILGDAIIEMLTGDLSPIFTRKVKRITDKHRIGLEFTEKGEAIITTPVKSN